MVINVELEVDGATQKNGALCDSSKALAIEHFVLAHGTSSRTFLRVVSSSGLVPRGWGTRKTDSASLDDCLEVPLQLFPNLRTLKVLLLTTPGFCPFLVKDYDSGSPR